MLEGKFGAFVPYCRVFTYLLFTKQGIIQNLLHQLKYGNCPEIGIALGKMCATDWLPQLCAPFDAIIPLPLHTSRQAKRGYNQSEQIAIGLNSIFKTQVITQAVMRKKATTTQTNFSRLKRWKNVENIFEVQKPDLIAHKNILLVDDVITTGATMLSLAIEVNKYMPKSVTVLGLAHPHD